MIEPESETEVTTTEEPNPSAGSVRLGPLVISAKFSIILIYFAIIGFNVLLLLLVVLAAMHRAGRL